MREILSQDDVMAVFYATEVECVSAFSRRLREESLDPSSFDGAIDVLIALLEHWLEILPTHDLRLDAEALLTIHPLKTADALQLAAALLWCEGNTSEREFVSLDDRLREAADDEGFIVLPRKGA